MSINYNPVKNKYDEIYSDQQVINKLKNKANNAFIRNYIDQRINIVNDNFSQRSVNNKDNIYLKDYIVTKAEKNGIQFPQGLEISATSPEKLSDEIKADFKDVIFKDYKGYIISFFALIHNEDKDFEKELSTIKLNPDRKEKIRKLRNCLNNYYKLELKLPDNNKKYNLTNLTDSDKQEILNNIADKNLAEFLVNESENLKKISRNFSNKELKKEVFFEAGKESRGLVGKLLITVAALAGLDHFNPAIVKACGGEQNGLGRVLDKAFWIAGSGGDDVAGCYKDYYQDKEVLGKKTATWLAWASAAVGVGSSILIGNKMDDLLKKHGDKLKLTNKLIPPIKMAVIPLVILFGLCSSGSSIASNIGTFWIMRKNQDKLREKGILKDENKSFISKLKETWKNYSSYEAYIGKIVGISSCIPLAVGLSGLIFSKNSIVKAVSVAILGSFETITACGFQKYADKYRKYKIDKEKQNIVKNV